MNEKKNILICPLEWGLGHAGRMVPVAKRLLELNHNVFFGSGKELLSFLKDEVPEASAVHFPGFRIKYSGFLPQYLIILVKSPLLLYHIYIEHIALRKIIRDFSIDIVISDNRIGLWNKEIKTVFVTHQVRIRFPKPFRFLEFTALMMSRSIIKKYSYCFIPDLEGELNVSGELSHGLRLPANTRYIGILSRFSEPFNSVMTGTGKCTVILSGPEPQRSILEQKLTKILLSTGLPSVILKGKPAKGYESYKTNNILYYYNLPRPEILKLLRESDTIITRSGYTTIMELVSLGISALLIPTPGQTEQEYLAESLSQKGWFSTLEQKALNEKSLIPAVKRINALPIVEESRKLLESALRELLE